MPHFAERDEKTNAFRQQVCNLCHYYPHCLSLLSSYRVPWACYTHTLYQYTTPSLSPQFVCYVTTKLISVSLIVCRRYHTICQHYHGVCHYNTQDAHECWSAVISALAHSLPVQDDPQVRALYRE